ncbi:MAG TPA: hypothetical protein VF883_16445 [Thermoanaerobaculia bacterium]|jgi:hypothetical protein
MDQEILVKAFRKVAAQLEKAHGPLALMLLVAPDEETSNSWNVVVSARGLDSKSLGEGVRELSRTLRASLNESLWPMVSRVTFLRTDDPFVHAFTQRYPTLRSGSTLEAVSVSGIDIPRAVVVETNRLAA